MSRKSRHNDNKPRELEPGENLGNPFADLKIDFPEEITAPKPPPPPPPPSKEQVMESELSKADKALLDIFRDAGDVQSITWTATTPTEQHTSGKYLKLVQQRKGHNGKTVTLVHGFKEVGMDVRMKVCYDIKKELGIGARFLDAVLELQGDQRERAAKWFEAHGYKCEIPQ